jgi:hypothetical protein
LTRTHVHVVASPGLPPENVVVERKRAVDILAVTGLVLSGRVHARMTASDDRAAIGGHLKPGCRSLTFATVAIAKTPEIDLSGWGRSYGSGAWSCSG